MNEPQLKQLLKGIVREVRRRRSSAGGEYDLEDIEIDGQTIPKVVTPEHILKFDIRVEYDASPGCPGRYYGRPEDCYPDEPPEVEPIDVYMTRLEISPPKSEKYIEVNIDKLGQKFPQIWQAFNNIAKAYVDDHWDDISNSILDTIDWDYDPRDEPDYDR